MTTWRRLALLASLAFAPPAPLSANAITFDFRPSNDPRATVLCTVQLQSHQMVALEIVGINAPPLAPLRWPANEADTLVLLHALGALLAQEIASVDDAILARPPQPPYVSVRWFAQTNDGLASGLYLQSGLVLPPALASVVERLLLGGPCAELAAS
jgi:hypothetical protein